MEWTCKWLTDSEQLAKRQVVDRGTSLKLTWKNNQTSKRQKWNILDVFGYFGRTENGTSGARIKMVKVLVLIGHT